MNRSISAAEVAGILVGAGDADVNRGEKLIRAARRVSEMAEMSAAQKADVVLEFIRRIGFATSKEGVVDEGATLRMKSENERAAFRFVKETAKILYGKFDTPMDDYLWTEL